MSLSRADRSKTVVIDEGRVCFACGSSRSSELLGESCLHFPGGLESLDKPPVWAFPQVLVCLECGTAQFSLPEEQLKLIQGKENGAERPAS